MTMEGMNSSSTTSSVQLIAVDQAPFSQQDHTTKDIIKPNEQYQQGVLQGENHTAEAKDPLLSLHTLEKLSSRYALQDVLKRMDTEPETVPDNLEKLVLEVNQTVVDLQWNQTALLAHLTSTIQFCDSYAKRVTDNFARSETQTRSLMRQATKKAQKQLIRELDLELRSTSQKLDQADKLKRQMDAKRRLLLSRKNRDQSSLIQMPDFRREDKRDGQESGLRFCPNPDLKRIVLLTLVVIMLVSVSLPNFPI